MVGLSQGPRDGPKDGGFLACLSREFLLCSGAWRRLAAESQLVISQSSVNSVFRVWQFVSVFLAAWRHAGDPKNQTSLEGNSGEKS